MKKKKLALFLSLIMVLSVFPMTVFASEFTDMPNNWSTPALEKAVANGLLKGDKGKIRAEDNLTRAEMATIVNRSFQSNKVSSLKAFKDLAPGDWYYEEMGKAVGMGIFKGTGDKLKPRENITREEAFLVLARAFKISEVKKGVLDKFSDKDSISTWAKDGVSALVSAGYIAGSKGQINPKEDITRAEFAQIMDNLLKTYITKAGQYTEDYKGNVMINKAGVTLKGNTLDGDLIIGDGVGDGEITLDDVTIKGRLVVRGGGENSIRIIGGSNVKNIIIARVDGIVRVYSEDGVEIGEVIIDGNDDVILEGEFEGVTILAEGIKVVARNANIQTLTSQGTNTTIEVDKNSTIDNVEANGENTTIEGECFLQA